jgi:hypothetical protein
MKCKYRDSRLNDSKFYYCKIPFVFARQLKLMTATSMRLVVGIQSKYDETRLQLIRFVKIAGLDHQKLSFVDYRELFLMRTGAHVSV